MHHATLSSMNMLCSILLIFLCLPWTAKRFKINSMTFQDLGHFSCPGLENATIKLEDFHAYRSQQKSTTNRWIHWARSVPKYTHYIWKRQTKPISLISYNILSWNVPNLFFNTTTVLKPIKSRWNSRKNMFLETADETSSSMEPTLYINIINA